MSTPPTDPAGTVHPAAGIAFSNSGSNIKVLLPELADKQDYENWYFKLNGCLKRHQVGNLVQQQLKCLEDPTETAPVITKEEQNKLLIIEEAVVNSLADGPEAPAAGMARNNNLTELAPIMRFFQKQWGSSEELDEELLLEEFHKEKWSYNKDLDAFISTQIGRLNRCPSLVPPGRSFSSHMKLMLCRVAPGDLQSIASQCRADSTMTYHDVAKRFKDWIRSSNREPDLVRVRVTCLQH